MGGYGEGISSHAEKDQAENIILVEMEIRKKGNPMKIWERAEKWKSTCQASNAKAWRNMASDESLLCSIILLGEE